MNFTNYKINNFPIHPIGIGTWLMGGGFYLDKTPYAIYGTEETEIAAIRYALDRGQNHIDTAQSYGAGHTEEIVGEAIKGYDRSKIFLATKFAKTHSNRLAIIHEVDEMLKRLQTNYIDLLYMHHAWQPEVSLPDCIQGMNDVVESGKVKAIGVSNFTFEQLKQAQELSNIPISAIQNYYSLSDRQWSSPEFQEYCQKEKIAFVACKPLGRQLFANHPLLEEFTKKYTVSVSQLALAWLLAQENVIPIPKATSSEHIVANLKAMEIKLETEDVEKLTELSLSS